MSITETAPFFMVDVDYVREWDRSTIGATYYTETWADESDHDNLLHQGYSVLATYVWE